jgi:hypothetical protein
MCCAAFMKQPQIKRSRSRLPDRSNEPALWLPAERALRRWREQTTGRPHLPDSLWEIACTLVEQNRIPATRVASRLKLNPSSLRRQLRRRRAARKQKKPARSSLAAKPVSFVPVSLPSISSAPSEPVEIELRTSTGTFFALRGDPYALRRLLKLDATESETRPC